MEDKNLSSELKEINASIEKLRNDENMIKKVYSENKDNTRDYFDKKIKIIEDNKRKELSKLRVQEEGELSKISIEKEPFTNRKEEIKKMFKLNSIKENLNEDVEVKLSIYGTPDPVEKEENLSLMKIGCFIKENKKPKNKYDLIIQAFFKNSKLENYFNLRWRNEILEKSFETIEKAQAYLNKHYEKIVLEVKTKHDEIFAEMEKINIKLNDEFNFNVVSAYSHQWELKAEEKNKAIFINTYDENKKFEVEFLGDNKFKLSNEEEKRECELSLEKSIFSLTPEIIIQ